MSGAVNSLKNIGKGAANFLVTGDPNSSVLAATGGTDAGAAVGGTPSADESAPSASVTGPQNADVQKRVSDFKTLEQDVGQRASAAGAVRSGSDSDLLGLGGPAKRRAATRTLLG